MSKRDLNKMYLNQVFDPKNNSLTFIRFILASLVVLSHSYILGGFGDEPLKYFKVSPGQIAVEGFFAISGFLIMRSFLKSNSLGHYLWKRFLRIFPGFWVCLFLTTFILAPIIYFIQNKTFANLTFFKNPFIGYASANFLLLISQQHLRGVFLLNPQKEILNGSLWTLFPEFLCYLSLPLIGAVFFIKRRKKYLIFFFFLLLLINNLEGIMFGYFDSWRIYDKLWSFFLLRRLFSYFFAGVILCLYDERILFNNALFFTVLALFIISIYARIYNFIGSLLLAYILIGLSIKLPFSYFDKYGDYSYGLYIYAYPVQQTIYFLYGGLKHPLVFFIISMLATMIPAYLSWIIVEKRCLKKKNLFLKSAKRII